MYPVLLDPNHVCGDLSVCTENKNGKHSLFMEDDICLQHFRLFN